MSIKADRNPIFAEQQAGRWFLGEPVSIAPEGINCPILSKDAIVDSTYVSGGGQTSFLSGTLIGESVESTANQERLVDEYKRRAEACNNGTCPAIGRIATCYRRIELPNLDPERTPMDELLER